TAAAPAADRAPGNAPPIGSTAVPAAMPSPLPSPSLAASTPENWLVSGYRVPTLRSGPVTCQAMFSKLRCRSRPMPDTLSMRRSRPGPPADSPLLFLAGHPALDFLNTRKRADGELVDLLRRDEDVLRWLERAGFPAPEMGPNTASPSLVDAARTLRESIRSLVEKRKTGQRGDPAVLNGFLAEAQSHPRLSWDKPPPLG